MCTVNDTSASYARLNYRIWVHHETCCEIANVMNVKENDQIDVISCFYAFALRNCCEGVTLVTICMIHKK